MMRLTKMALSIAAVGAAGTMAIAQMPPTQTLSFAAASVKPAAPSRYQSGRCHGRDTKNPQDAPLGRCVFQNSPLLEIIQTAYQDKLGPNGEIKNAPAWVNVDQFNI